MEHCQYSTDVKFQRYRNNFTCLFVITPGTQQQPFYKPETLESGFRPYRNQLPGFNQSKWVLVSFSVQQQPVCFRIDFKVPLIILYLKWNFMLFLFLCYFVLRSIKLRYMHILIKGNNDSMFLDNQTQQINLNTLQKLKKCETLCK